MAAITFPYDLLAGFPGWQGEAKLMRRQERSRTASGRTIVKDLGDPLWTAQYITKAMKPNALDRWRARLDVLEEGLNTFKGYFISRCYPIKYPKGTWPTGVAFSGAGLLSAIEANRKEIRVSGFPAGYEFSEGDIIMLGAGFCVRVVKDFTVPSTASAGPFEVRPHLKPGINVGIAATVKNPWVTMAIDPDSKDDAAGLDGVGQVTFTATEAV